jgi:predicted methyltransferase
MLRCGAWQETTAAAMRNLKNCFMVLLSTDKDAKQFVCDNHFHTRLVSNKSKLPIKLFQNPIAVMMIRPETKTSFLQAACLAAILLLTGCASGQVKSVPKDTLGYSTKAPHPDGTGKVYVGREIAHVMGTSGGEWLERDTRQQEESVDQAIAKMPLQRNSVVADIGAGTGYYTFRIAPKIPDGKLYAVEVQDAFVATLERKKQEQHAANVTVVKGIATAPNLPDSSVDLAFMVDVYHELEYPHEMLQALYKALKPDGKLLLVEYRAEDPAVPIKALHKMSMAQVTREMTANGFTLYKSEPVLPIQHFLLYEKMKK